MWLIKGLSILSIPLKAVKSSCIYKPWGSRSRVNSESGRLRLGGFQPSVSGFARSPREASVWDRTSVCVREGERVYLSVCVSVCL